MQLPAAIFREYDIRGIVGDQLTPEVARAIGQAIATLGWDRLGRAPRLAVGGTTAPPARGSRTACSPVSRPWAATAWTGGSCRRRRSTSPPTCSTWTAASR